MIFCGETTKENKKSIFLFCVRDDEELKQLMGQKNSANDFNEDILVSNDNNNPSSENTKDEECTNMFESNNNNKQSEYSKDCEYENAKINKQIRADHNISLEKNFESEIEGNDKKMDVIPAMHVNEKSESNTWDDYYCYKISQEDFFPSKVTNLDTQKLIITRFLNFYVGGKVPKGLRASDIVFATISIIPLTGNTEESIWHENEYRDDGSLFFITPEEKLNTEFKAIAKKRTTSSNTLKDNSEIIELSSSTNKLNEKERKHNTDSPTCHNEEPSKSVENNQDLDSINIHSNPTSSDADHKDALSSYIHDLVASVSINWHGSTTRSGPLQHSFKLYGPSENSAFISSCNKLLIQWEESEESRIILKYFFGIIALTLMRGIVKGKKNIINTFKSEKFLNKIKFIDSKISYSTPYESCIEKCCRELKLIERHHKVMFAKMLFNSIRIDCMQKKDLITTFYGLFNIFRMCVIDHIAYYDMGIINLLKTIYGYVGPGTQFSIILGELKSEEINHSMDQVRNFIKTYMNKDGKCWTYHWARYFDPKQFEYLSCTTSYAAAVMLAVFVEKMTHRSDVWRSGWVRSHQEDLDKYKQLAKQMYEQYELLSEANRSLFHQFFEISTIDGQKR